MKFPCDMPEDAELRFRRAAKALIQGGGIVDLVIVAFSKSGHFKIGGVERRNDALALAKVLRLVADHIEQPGRDEVLP